MIDTADFQNYIRRIVQEIAIGRHTKSTLCVTSYDPVQHAVKGIIQPSGVESGWVPISVIHAGPGYGILVGPLVGDADGNGGDQFDLDHELGDPNNLVARHKQFSTPDAPPQVQSGEMLLQHQNGNKVSFTADGSLTLTHGKSGATMFFDAQGNITHDAKDQSISVKSAKGITLAASGTGTIALTGPATLNGLPIQTAA